MYNYNAENQISEKSFQFAIRIVKLYIHLTEKKRVFVLSKQLLRSGTSVGANVAEAQRAQSRADFISKMSIASKEVAESEYWIKLLHATDFLNDNEFASILADCTELGKLLTAILKTTKKQ